MRDQVLDAHSKGGLIGLCMIQVHFHNFLVIWYDSFRFYFVRL